MLLFVAHLSSPLFRPPSSGPNHPSTVSSNTLSQCSSLMYRPSSTPIPCTQQAVAVFATFSDSQRQYKIPERTAPDIPTVSRVPSCVTNCRCRAEVFELAFCCPAVPSQDTSIFVCLGCSVSGLSVLLSDSLTARS